MATAISANLEAACQDYAALKNRMREELPDDLEWYEHSDKEGWHYTTITSDNYLRLFYRVVWSSGFRAETVFGKEEAYFQLLYSHLLSGQPYDPSNEMQFLAEVAPILGGHSENRKNKAVVHLVRLIATLGWDNFRQQYVSPGPDLEARLLELPMIGPKTVRLLLNQTGIRDIAKDDIWVTRFAEAHGFTDPHECVRMMSQRLGDTQTTIDAVLFWAGRKHGLNATPVYARWVNTSPSPRSNRIPRRS